jgi:hypothetical protein
MQPIINHQPADDVVLPLAHRRRAAARPRRIVGPDGREWIVKEIPLPLADCDAGHCLWFQSADVVRRVPKFPFDWFARSDAELFDLSLRA